MTTTPAGVDLLDVLLAAADRLDLPLTTRAVRALAAEAERTLARPADPGPAPHQWAHGPTAGQLDNLIEKTRSRALTAAEVDRLASGVTALRDAALAAGPTALRSDPLDHRCPVCEAPPGRRCTTLGGHPCQPHRHRLRLAV